MSSDPLRERTEALMRKSRVYDRPGDRSGEPSLLLAFVLFGILGLVLFFFLFFAISSLYGDASESAGSKLFFLGLLLALCQLFPFVFSNVLNFVESRGVYGTWISTKRTLFHKKSDNDYAAIDWADVQAVEKIGPNLVFRGRHRKVAVPTNSLIGNLTESTLYLWFLNRLIEDYGPDRPDAERLHELREKITCPLLHPFIRKSARVWFLTILFGLLPGLLFLAGLPLFYAQLNAGRDPLQSFFAMQIWFALAFLSILLLLIPMRLHRRHLRKQARQIYEADTLPLLQQPLPRVSTSDFEKCLSARRDALIRFPSDEETKQFLATIPPPPRSVSAAARRRFLISGEAIFFTAFIAGTIVLCTSHLLFQGTERSIRESQFWNWTPAGTGIIVRVDPVHQERSDDKKMIHTADRFEFSFRHADGTETRHLDTRELKIGVYKIGQSVPVQSFRGDERFLRLDAKTWNDDSLPIILSVPVLIVFTLVILSFWTRSFTEGPKKIRFWETAETGWGKVVKSTSKGTTVRLAEPERKYKTIFCPGVMYYGRNNLRRPLTLFLDPEDPAEGTTIQPLPFGLRVDPKTGELVVDPKKRWVWPAVVGLVLLAIVLSICAALKFFAV